MKRILLKVSALVNQDLLEEREIMSMKMGEKKGGARIPAELRKIIGKNIATLLEMHDWNQVNLEKFLQYAPGAGMVSQILSGKKTPTFQILRKMEKHFNLPPGTLMNDKIYTEQELKQMDNLRRLLMDKKDKHHPMLRQLLKLLDQDPKFKFEKIPPPK